MNDGANGLYEAAVNGLANLATGEAYDNGLTAGTEKGTCAGATAAATGAGTGNVL